METPETVSIPEKKGAFNDSLRRNNKQIRQDRADAISEDAEVLYKRKIEDIAMGLKKMKRDRDNMLDMSPSDTTTIITVSDFHGDEYVAKDLDLSVKIRNEEIRLEVAVKRFVYLFGYNPSVPTPSTAE